MTDATAILARIDELAPRAMENWHIPGMALALLLPGQEPIVRTWGVRDTRTGEPVTARTQFHACSLTKSITAAGIVLLMQERKLPLTTRVRDLLPELRFSDAYVTEHLTVRDLLCHASGLPRHDKTWTPGDRDWRELVPCLRHLAFSAGLRERYQYNNLGYVVLAAIVERLAATDWETHTTDTLLAPLGFRDFGWGVEALAAAPDHAHPHPRLGSTSRPAARMWPAPHPAGGLNASVEDLARWVRFLAGGDLPGVAAERTRAVLQDMTTPWIYSGTSPHAEIGAMHYGLGVACERYRLHRHVAHGGAMPGWSTLFSLLPDEGIGLAVLTNRDPTPIPLMLAFAAYDAFLGLEPVDWYARFAKAREVFLAQEQAQEKEQQGKRAAQPARALADYAGRYTEPAYGTITVEARGDRLHWDWRGLAGTLESEGHDRFALWDDPRHQEQLRAVFLDDAQGTIDRMAFALEDDIPDIVFRRELSPRSPSAPASPS